MSTCHEFSARILCPAWLLMATCFPAPVQAESAAESFNGDWVVNEKLSDDPDRRVEAAIMAAGGEPDSGGRKGRGRYRGGPEEHELYDRAAYDQILTIHIDFPRIAFTYEDGFVRTFYSDGRGRSASAKGRSRDYSFADWGKEGELLVESVPRDGGWTKETYFLQAGGEQLRAELILKPLTFSVPIRILRIYDRRNGDNQLMDDNLPVD